MFTWDPRETQKAKEKRDGPKRDKHESPLDQSVVLAEFATAPAADRSAPGVGLRASGSGRRAPGVGLWASGSGRRAPGVGLHVGLDCVYVGDETRVAVHKTLLLFEGVEDSLELNLVRFQKWCALW